MAEGGAVQALGSDRDGTLILLHGHDDDPARFHDVAARLAPAGFVSQVPCGPIEADGRRSWWASDDDGEPDAPQVRAALAQLDALVTAAGADGARVVVVGFSQGGALALLWALRTTADEGAEGDRDGSGADEAGSAGTASPLTALAVISAWLPTVDGIELDPASCRAARVLVAHGDDDETVAPQLGRATARLLERHEVDTTLATSPSGHELEPFVTVVREWLTPPR